MAMLAIQAIFYTKDIIAYFIKTSYQLRCQSTGAIYSLIVL